MSITDELREWATVSWDPWPGARKRLSIMCDRIDEAHKHAIAYVDDRDQETMAENGWVRLPKDADGVPILDGDKMVAPHGDVFIATHMMLENGTWTIHGWKPSFLHHHKSPVEDVLYELINRLFDDDESATDKKLIAEYAAKLRLAEGEDE